jgi:hypothetical protein
MDNPELSADEKAVALGKVVAGFLTDPAFAPRLFNPSKEDQDAMRKDPKGFFADAGYPVPEGFNVSVPTEPIQPFGLGKVCVHVGPFFCYCHGAGQKC